MLLSHYIATAAAAAAIHATARNLLIGRRSSRCSLRLPRFPVSLAIPRFHLAEAEEEEIAFSPKTVKWLRETEAGAETNAF